MLLWRLATLWSLSSTINFAHIKTSLVKWMRVECTLNSYSAQFTFSLISFQHTCDCVYVQGKSTFSQKRSGGVSPRRVAETPLYTLPLCQLIYSNGKRKWTRVHHHGSYCHSISVESCRDYAGDGTVKDNQKHAQVFQVLALVCLFPGKGFKLFRSHMQHSWKYGHCWVVFRKCIQVIIS